MIFLGSFQHSRMALSSTAGEQVEGIMLLAFFELAKVGN